MYRLLDESQLKLTSYSKKVYTGIAAPAERYVQLNKNSALLFIKVV